jgi:putative exporter of polyketide antibiotics
VKSEYKETLVLVVCAVAGLALLIATIGAALALLTGHARWIELAWLSMASSLFVLVLRKLWPIETDEARSD